MTTVQTIGGEQVATSLEQHRTALEEARTHGKSYALDKWLSYLEAINPQHMALGLDRVREVAQRLHLYSDLLYLNPFVVTIAGTNGKGSTAALIADACQRCGCKVGLFTSPHLLHFNERIQLSGHEISDELLQSCLYEVIAAQFPDAALEPVCLDCATDEELAAEHDAATLRAQHCADAAGNGDTAAASNAANAAVATDADADDLLAEDDDELFADDELLEEDQRLAATVKRNMALGLEITDESPVQELALAVEQQARPLRDDIIDLTYFEIATLAALRAMAREHCNLWVLEVGLGGRLDAVNAFPNDLAIITSIGLDHMKILGNTTTQIAHEKAGIIKSLSEVILGANIDPAAMKEIMQTVKRLGAHAEIENQHFKVRVVPSADGKGPDEIQFRDSEMRYDLFLPYPKVPVSCAGIALHAILHILRYFLERDLGRFEDLHHIAAALQETALPGRMQLMARDPVIYLDVAHNVPAAIHLREAIMRLSRCSQNAGTRRAVIGMLKDKDVEGVLQVLKDAFGAFYLADLSGDRGEQAARLAAALQGKVPSSVQVQCFASVAAALAAARAEAKSVDEIIVCGSFVTVAEATQALQAQ